MKFVERNIACGWSDEQQRAKQTRLLSIKPEPLCNVVAEWAHAREGGILHEDKKHRMPE